MKKAFSSGYHFLKIAALAVGLFAIAIASPASALTIKNDSSTSIRVTLKNCVPEAITPNVKADASYKCVNCNGACNYTVSNPVGLEICTGEVHSDKILEVAGPKKCTVK